MDPIPETVEVVDEFGPFGSDDILRVLDVKAAQVQRLVPDCVGMSLAMVDHGVTLTLVATQDEVAALDGVQYLFDGPCVEAVDVGRVVGCESREILDEQGWHRFARASAASGIASTLTLPLRSHELVVGSVNLYAASAGAFVGSHSAIAEIFGAWAPEAVLNADLSFRTRRIAEQAPERLRQQLRVDFAVGYLSAALDVTIDEARRALRDAAQRAGVTETALADVLMAMQRDDWQ